MTTTLYISNREIQAVSGNANGKQLTVSKFASTPIVSGMMAGGTIVEPEAIATTLDFFLKENNFERKNLQLAVDTDTMLVRVMETPVLSDKKLRLLIRNEMAEQATGAGLLLYDYAVLEGAQPGGGAKILACAIERELIGAYKAMFDNAKIGLSGINPALASAISLTKAIPELADKTFTLSILDGSNIFSLLFLDGSYHFSNRGMLQEQRGTLAAATEISRALSSLLQFNATQRSAQNPLSAAYICGLRGEEVDFLPDISSSLGVEAGLLPAPPGLSGAFAQEEAPHYSDFLYCVGNLLK